MGNHESEAPGKAPRTEHRRHVLPDLLSPGLAVVFVGTAAGAASAVRRAYYAGPGNRFWPMLAETGLTARLLEPEEYGLLLEYGIGLTDMAKHVSGADAGLRRGDFDRAGFVERIREAGPRMVAFNGKKAASVFFSRPTARLAYGSAERIEGFPPIFILPSTSRAANGSWSAAPWHALAETIRRGGLHPG